ncbi:LuxR C-terminal-related transcriptional regulator [Streptomyces sp. NPDC006332]|uniref:helix-turn-helix transcriptional regulator n=1 Tax=Streptomyces sp. NPDC006332 TaxID=3155456 RepID=UPI0033A5D5A8
MPNGGGRTGKQSTDLALALYQELRARGASSLRGIASEMDLSDDETDRCRNELLTLGLVVATGPAHDNRLELDAGKASEEQSDAVTVVAPEIALLRLLERERTRLRNHLEQADRAHNTLKTLAGNFLRVEMLTQASGVEVEILHDYRRIQQVLEDITVTVRHGLSSMHPIARGREIPERALNRDRRQIENGVQVRSIFSQRLAGVPEDAEHLRAKAELGVQVRLSPVVPMNMIIADDQFAILPVNPEDHTAGAILAHGSALVRSYQALFEHAWHMATPFGDQTRPAHGGDGLREQQRAALRMLASGMKDEKVARNLGVSLRTVSRMISDLMQELDASSRFEAGVRAALMGWLD